jgi:hypothetical protein
MPPQLHYSISGALCPMRARGLGRGHRLAANLHVSRPTRQLAPDPSQGGNGVAADNGAGLRYLGTELTEIVPRIPIGAPTGSIW